MNHLKRSRLRGTFWNAVAISMVLTHFLPIAEAASVSIYVARDGVGRVSVVDADTLTLVDEIPVARLKDLAVLPGGGWVYALDSINREIAVIDTTLNAVVDTIAVPALSKRIFANADGSRVYVTFADGISIIDTASGSLTRTVPVQGLGGELVFASDGTSFGASFTSGPFGVFSTLDNEVQGAVTFFPGRPGEADVLPGTNLAYVATALSGVPELGVVDLDSASLVDVIPVPGSSLFDVVALPDGTSVFASYSSGIHVVDVASGTLVDTANVSGGALMAAHPDSTSIYMVNINWNELRVLDVASNVVVDSLPMENLTTLVIAGVPVCGDGEVDAAEQCDDGNTSSGDGCSAECLSELSFPLIAEEWRCQDAIGKAGFKYATLRMKALRRCRTKIVRGQLTIPASACPVDPKTAAQIQKGGSKARRTIEARCTDHLLTKLQPCATGVDAVVNPGGDGGCLIDTHAVAVDSMVEEQYGP